MTAKLQLYAESSGGLIACTYEIPPTTAGLHRAGRAEDCRTGALDDLVSQGNIVEALLINPSGDAQ